jgi:glyoxylase-like metal-dependent hydrolase (beta-lactamase superfamily II)
MHVDAFSVPVDTRAPDGATNAYVVGSEECLLVDPAARTSTLDTVVAAREVTGIAVTHTHPDHVGAVAEYAAETGAEVLARRPDRFEAATGVDPDRRIAEGSVIETGVGSVTVLDTPGHAADHVAFELPDGDAVSGGIFISGDLAVAEGSVVVGAPEGDLRAYLTALRRLWARNPRRLYPGHGPLIGADPGPATDGPVSTDSHHATDGPPSTGAPSDEATAPREVLERLVLHRLERERKVLAAVHAGATDLDAVVDAAYDKNLSGVRDLARATVRAHLEKLAVERRVRFDAETGAVAPANR